MSILLELSNSQQFSDTHFALLYYSKSIIKHDDDNIFTFSHTFKRFVMKAWSLPWWQNTFGDVWYVFLCCMLWISDYFEINLFQQVVQQSSQDIWHSHHRHVINKFSRILLHFARHCYGTCRHIFHALTRRFMVVATLLAMSCNP